MRLRNILIVVKDIEKSKKFYHDLFGLDIILDNDENVILTEGLVLQDEKVWKDVTYPAMPTVSVCAFFVEVRDRANINSFHENRNAMSPATPTDDLDIGRTTFSRIPHAESPSSSAASSTSLGICPKKFFNIHMISVISNGM